jgi:hypothetical protein
MSVTTPITFVVSVGDEAILENNFLASPCLAAGHPHRVLIQRGFKSAAAAYNDAIARSENDLIVLAHSDMLFPSSWLSDLDRALDSLEETDPRWGVLGCYGVTLDRKFSGYLYSNGQGFCGAPFVDPTPVQTLDEIVLIIRKSSGLRFDERLPHFHLYGADICLRAAQQQRRSYAIPAFCVHNTHRNLILADDFYACYRQFKKIWGGYLPVQTSCVRVTKFDRYMYQRKLWEIYLRYIRGLESTADRAENPQVLLDQVSARLNSGESLCYEGDRLSVCQQ